MKTSYIQLTSLAALAGLFLAPSVAFSQITAATVTDLYANRAVSGSYTEPTPAAGSASNLADFRTSVSTAFASGRGGVTQFETGVGTALYTPNTPFSTINLSYAGGSKTLSLGISKINDASTAEVVRVGSYGSASSVSGMNMLDRSNGGTDATEGGYQFNFSLSGSLVPNERVYEFGFSALSRSSYSSTFTAVATLNDATTQTVTVNMTNVGNNGTGANNNQHISFSSPTGKWFTSVSFNTTNTSLVNQRTIIDDFAFSTIPEPSTYAALAGLLALGLVAYKRRQR